MWHGSASKGRIRTWILLHLGPLPWRSRLGDVKRSKGGDSEICYVREHQAVKLNITSTLFQADLRQGTRMKREEELKTLFLVI